MSSRSVPLVALVLAGRRSAAADPVAAVSGRSVKAFAPVGGRPMIERVIDALEQSGRIEGIRVSLPDGLPLDAEAPGLAARLRAGSVGRVASGVSPAESVLRALEEIEPGGALLVTTGDHPLLDAAMVTAFLDGAAVGGPVDVAAALTPVAPIRALCPGMRRTGLRFRDGAFAGCNLFLLSAPGAVSVVRFWLRLESDRKRPLRMIRHLGLFASLLYACGMLTLEGALRRLGRTTGASLRAVRLADPRAGIDVDSVDDLAAVRKLVEPPADPGARDS